MGKRRSLRPTPEVYWIVILREIELLKVPVTVEWAKTTTGVATRRKRSCRSELVTRRLEPGTAEKRNYVGSADAERGYPEEHRTPAPVGNVLSPQAWINPPSDNTMRHEAAGATLSGWSIPRVAPDSGQRDEISPDADGDRPGPTSLPALIEAH